MKSQPQPIHIGKVRDSYAIGRDYLLIVASNRISVFDVVLGQEIPGKGAVLTSMTEFWLTQFFDNVPSHFVTTDMVGGIPTAMRAIPDLDGRGMVVKKLDMLPVEAIVRGHITGSGWKDYCRTGAICGIELSAGLQESQELPEPIYTPSTKAALGDKDQNVDFETTVRLIGDRGIAVQVRDISLDLFDQARHHAAERGIIIADTKFEFGLDGHEVVTLADEVLTPDSSRFWPADQVVLGKTPPSFDKQPVRDYCARWIDPFTDEKWDKQPPGPPLPDEVITATQGRYQTALTRLTG